MSGGRTCTWCDRVVVRLVALFVNGHGWTDACGECLRVAGRDGDL